jgi:predicted nucleic acid-binding protein
MDAHLLVDTNVVLDLLLRRAPFFGAAQALVAAIETRQAKGLLGATSVTTAYYFTRRAYGDARARRDLADLLALFEVAPVTKAILAEALAAPLADFEDAVLAFAGLHAGATGVVTRDPAGFAGGPLPVYTPAEALALLAAS